MAEKKATSLVIGPCVLSYAHLTEPKAIGDSTEKKYSVSMVIPKSEKGMIKQINAAIEAAKAEGKTSKWGGKIPTGPKFKLPLRDGDEERDTDPVYADCYFINANSNNRPQVVDANRNEILDKEKIYSGMIGLVSVNFFPYDSNGSKGIAVGLNNVLKLRDGEKLSGGTTAAEDFGDIDLTKFGSDDDDQDDDVDMSLLD